MANHRTRKGAGADLAPAPFLVATAARAITTGPAGCRPGRRACPRAPVGVTCLARESRTRLREEASASPDSTGQLKHQISQLAEGNQQLGACLAKRQQDLAAARAANRELTARLDTRS